MKRLAGLAAVATVVLAGCGTTGTPAASGNSPTAAAHTSAPPTCHQQYETWKTGPAKALSVRLTQALTKVKTAGGNEDIPQLQAGLKSAAQIARKLAAYPMPQCADPGGYWGQFLGHLEAAGDNANSSSGLGALILAMAPLKSVPGIEQKISAEVKKNAGES
jgi:hypothetical protein